MRAILIFLTIIITSFNLISQNKRPREFGIQIGVLNTGKNNTITDVKGVTVGHSTKVIGDSIRTGVTAILPHSKNLYQNKVPAAIYIGNGYGKLAGYSQVEELGNIETPIILTNTLSVPIACEALISYTLNQDGNEDVRSVNSVVGETNDGKLNDIRGRHVSHDDVLSAIDAANNGPVKEGNEGAGTGTVCFSFKGGIGSSSRVLPESLGGFTVGVLVQTNFGGHLSINGVPVGKELGNYIFRDKILDSADGSCMIVVATDAPVDSRNLKRMAKRAMMGLARTGGIASNGSGDYVIAFSNFSKNYINPIINNDLYNPQFLHNSRMSPLFMATIEATEEAIINSLFAAETMTGKDGKKVDRLPIDKVIDILKKYNMISDEK